MAKEKFKKNKCFISIPPEKEFDGIKEIIREVCSNLDFHVITSSELSRNITGSYQRIFQEINSAEIVLAEVTNSNPNIFYEIGLAQAIGKPLLIFSKDMPNQPGISLANNVWFIYKDTPQGLNVFRKDLNSFLREFKTAPNKFYFKKNSLFPSKEIPYYIDLNKLEEREYENLCFELISQMGFRKVEWGKELREVDLVATLPKKDPDGFEYQELWFISLGMREESFFFIQRALKDPEYVLNRLLKVTQADLFNRYQQRYDTPFTILFVTAKSNLNENYSLEDEIKKFNRRMLERNFTSSLRVRFWDSDYLSNLIQRYPQIAYKYFSDEARISSGSRKSLEQLYDENVTLNQELLSVRNNLLEEKKKRFVAERNAAWKDVAFKAAHKLGNPIDAVDTFLQSLKNRLNVTSFEEARSIAESMDSSIEEAKGVISQFKSLTRAQEINFIESNLILIIKRAIKFALEQGIKVELTHSNDLPHVMLDPSRINECFNELIANSLHWFNKSEKKIDINIKRVTKRDLPTLLDDSKKYIKITYSDNGIGIPLDNKEKIFAPFFTTYPHGTGLGLSMVKTIIEGHGGVITENGIPDEGVIFVIFLPINQNDKG